MVREDGQVMINNFNDKNLEHFWKTGKGRKIPADIQNALKRKLVYIAAANDVNALRVPPANRLEILKGELKGSYSIRVNDQWRLVFRWEDNAAHDLKLMDYHK
jgi:proteic killer suppression protein